MTAEELLALIKEGEPPTILDVRTKREFANAHVPGALNIPFQEVWARVAEIPGAPGDPIVVYCGHGPRAFLAAAVLRARGFQQVSLLKGHWSRWQRLPCD